VADATKGRLARWTDKQRHEFNRLRAQNYGIKGSYRQLKELDEELFEYQYPTLASYTKSVQGVQEYDVALGEIRKEAEGKSYTHRGSRLDTLIEVGNKLLAAFRTTNAVTEMTKLSGEIRDTMKEIRLEVDPLGLESNAVASHFDKILTGFSSLDKRHQKMIASEEFWTEKTTEIEPN
jgi:hypothetical protein